MRYTRNPPPRTRNPKPKAQKPTTTPVWTPGPCHGPTVQKPATSNKHKKKRAKIIQKPNFRDFQIDSSAPVTTPRREPHYLRHSSW